MPATPEQLDLQRRAIIEAARDDEGRIPVDRLEATLGNLTGAFYPMAANDIMTIHITSGKVLLLQVVDRMDRLEMRGVLETTPGDPATRVRFSGTAGLILYGEPEEIVLPNPPLPDHDRPRPLDMPRRLESGHEVFEVRWTDPERPGYNTIHSHTRGDETPFKDCGCQITGLGVTDKYLVIEFNLNVDGTSQQWQCTMTQMAVIDRGTGGDRVREEGDLIQGGWHKRAPLMNLNLGVARVVAVHRAQTNELRQPVAHGVSFYTDYGFIFHPLRGDFSTVHCARDAAWTWRPAPGGVVLTRYELPLTI